MYANLTLAVVTEYRNRNQYPSISAKKKKKKKKKRKDLPGCVFKCPFMSFITGMELTIGGGWVIGIGACVSSGICFIIPRPIPMGGKSLWNSNAQDLTLKAPSKIVADDILNFYYYFSEKIRLGIWFHYHFSEKIRPDISCELSHKMLSL